MKKQVFIIGYYGFENVGDDLLLQKSIAYTQRHIKHALIAVLYACKTELRKDRVFYIPRYSIKPLLKALWASDYIVLGGGSILQDLSSKRSFWYYAGLLSLCVLFRKSIICLGIGVGPIRSKFNQWWWQWFQKYLEAVVVRDDVSLRACQNCRTAPIHGADLAFYKPLYYNNWTDKGLIGLSIRKEPRLASHIRVLNAWASKVKEERLIYLVAQKSHDQYFSDNVSTYTLTADSFQQATEMPLQAVLTMRYHVGVYAALHGIPFLALVGDEKLKSLALDLRQPYIDMRVDINTEISKVIASFLRRIGVYKHELDQQVRSLAYRAEKLEYAWRG